MNLKAVGLTIVATMSLTACGNNGIDEGQGVNDGVQQTRFNSTTDYPSPTGNTGNYTNERLGTENRGTNNNGTINNNRGTRLNNNNYGLNNQDIRKNNDNDRNRFEVADEAAERITDKVNEVEDAYVLTTDDNAYVAVELDRNNNDNLQKNGRNGNNVSDEIEQRIRKAVKAVDSDIDNVYVSTNPDFMNLTNNYVDDVNNGEPIEGFFDQIGEMIERVFPDAK